MGAFIGDTIYYLNSYANNQKRNIKRIVAFEPDLNNVEILKRNFETDKRLKIINKGLSDNNKVLKFIPDGSAGSFLKGDGSSLNGNEKIEVMIKCTSIDMIKECNDASFIKMDIEGMELDALKGARECIKKNHPKLAICIYHSLEDMVQIAEYIYDKYPEYKLFVRHHTSGKDETVLYAVYDV